MEQTKDMTRLSNATLYTSQGLEIIAANLPNFTPEQLIRYLYGQAKERHEVMMERWRDFKNSQLYKPWNSHDSLNNLLSIIRQQHK